MTDREPLKSARTFQSQMDDASRRGLSTRMHFENRLAQQRHEELIAAINGVADSIDAAVEEQGRFLR